MVDERRQRLGCGKLVLEPGRNLIYGRRRRKLGFRNRDWGWSILRMDRSDGGLDPGRTGTGDLVTPQVAERIVLPDDAGELCQWIFGRDGGHNGAWLGARA